MTKYKRFTIIHNGRNSYDCRVCSRYEKCTSNTYCKIEAYYRLQKLEDLIDDGKLIFVDNDEHDLVEIKVSRSWLREMHRILQEKDIDC